jgi:hypothetical protein
VSTRRSGLAGDGVGQVQAGACGATDGTWGQGCRWKGVVGNRGGGGGGDA